MLGSNLYVGVYVSSNTVYQMGTISGNTFTRDVNVPSKSGGYGYSGLYNYDGTRIVFAENDNSNQYYVSTYDGTTKSNLLSGTGYITANTTVISGRICSGVSIGSFAGDGFIYCDYPSGSNPLTITNNDINNSGQGQSTILFNGNYYAGGYNTPYIVKVNQLTSGYTKTTLNTGLSITSANNAAVILSTDSTYLLVVGSGLASYAYWDGTNSFVIKPLPSNCTVACSPTPIADTSSGYMHAVFYNSVTSVYSVYAWHKQWMDFTYICDLPSITTANANATSLTLEYVTSQWINGYLYVYGHLTLSDGTYQGIIYQLSQT